MIKYDFEEDELNFEEDLAIDPQALDVEWIEQPMKLMKYSMASAKAEKEAKEAHERVKLVRSDLVKKATKNPKKYLDEGVKPTGPNIEAFYREHPDHIQAKNEFIEAEYTASVIKSAVFAFNQRKTALEELVRLHGMQYFAGPKEPRDIGHEWKKHIEEATDKRTADKMRSKKAGKKAIPRKRKEK